MKRFIPKKRIILPIFAAASLSIAPFALANSNSVFNGGAVPNDNNTIKKGDTKITNAIKDLGDKMVALGFAGMTAFDQAMYQFDQNLLTTYNANTAETTINQNAASSASATKKYIKKSFQNIPNSFLSTAEDAINAKTIESQIKNQHALVNNLTLGVPGSDTLYINQPTVIAAGYGSFSPVISDYYNTNTAYTIGPPKMNDDNYFSISSILSPSAYTKKSLGAAKAYLAYLTESYQNPATALKLSSLKGYINGLKPSLQSAALYQFVSSPAYQKYQLALRSYMANKSIAIGNFESLIAERTPSKKKVAGIYNSKGKAISNPSPLQAEQYKANHRINNPAWIKSLQSMSSANVQREIAIELAQVIKQNQQAHMDRERILTTMSALQLQASQASHMTLVTMSQKVNQEIKDLGDNDNASSTATTNTESPRERAKQEAKKQAQEQKKQQEKKNEKRNF